MNSTLIKTSSKFGACINDFGVERCSGANLFWTSFPEMVPNRFLADRAALAVLNFYDYLNLMKVV